MKKTDLRIGNLVGIKETAMHADGCNHSEAIFEIEEIKKDVVQFKAYHANEYYKDLNPIPLTEQWLLDFGFEDEGGDDYIVTKGENSLLLSVEKDSIRVFLIYLYGTYNSEYTFLEDILYVHQLQNLYFALTQKELILKERSKE